MRTAVVATGLLCAAAVAWMLMTGRGGGDDQTDPTRGPDPTSATAVPASPDPSAALATPSIRPTIDVDRSQPPLGERPLFGEADAERRDPTWATATEAAIRKRVAGLLGDREQPRAPRVECRETVCRVLLTADDQAALRTFVAELSTRRGFVGVADTMALEDLEVEQAPDGSQRYSMRVMLVYGRK